MACARCESTNNGRKLVATKFRLQLFADNGRQSSIPFFTTEVPSDIIGDVIALFTEHHDSASPRATKTTEAKSPAKTTERPRRRKVTGKYCRGIVRDVRAYLQGCQLETIDIDYLAKNLRQYNRRQVATTMWRMSARGDMLVSLGRGEYQITKQDELV